MKEHGAKYIFIKTQASNRDSNNSKWKLLNKQVQEKQKLDYV